jgi:hypothetical protein
VFEHHDTDGANLDVAVVRPRRWQFLTVEAAARRKAPLIAGGAAIVGLAGAAALNSARSRRRKLLGVKMPRGMA